MWADSIREIDGRLAVACSIRAIDPRERMADDCKAEDIGRQVDAEQGGFGVVSRARGTSGRLRESSVPERRVLEYLLIEPFGDIPQYKDKYRGHQAHDPS